MTNAFIPEQPQDTYFISLTDLLVGLLFIFIVLLMAYSLIFQDSVEKLERELNERVHMRTELLKRIQLRLADGDYRSEVLEGEGVLRLEESVLFGPGQASLGPEAQGALTIIAEALEEELPCFGATRSAKTCSENSGPILEAVYIEGHTDDLAINTAQFRSNWELSSARSIATYNFLISKATSLSSLPNGNGSASLLGASAYADTRPVNVSDPPTFEGRQQNRRVDFRFLLSPPSNAELDEAAAQAVK